MRFAMTMAAAALFVTGCGQSDGPATGANDSSVTPIGAVSANTVVLSVPKMT